MTDLPILPPDTGVMLCGHGSRNQLAVGEFAVLADALKQKLPGIPVEYGYLEFANPVIHQGLDRLRGQGVKHVLAVPGMLFAAGLITGEALMGIFMAIPIVASGQGDVMALPASMQLGGAIGKWAGLALLAGVAFWLFRVGLKGGKNTESA